MDCNYLGLKNKDPYFDQFWINCHVTMLRILYLIVVFIMLYITTTMKETALNPRSDL